MTTSLPNSSIAVFAAYAGLCYRYPSTLYRVLLFHSFAPTSRLNPCTATATFSNASR